MIKARHTWFHIRFFRFYAGYRLRRNFSGITVHSPLPEVTGKPLLVIANHFSWWDGFFVLWLNNRLLHKKFYVMMLEEQLDKNLILRGGGAFSIKPGSRTVVESLRYAREILDADSARESPLLLMFPQGRIRSQHTRPLRFEKGLESITQGMEGKINILMTVVLVDYFSGQKPSLHYYLELYPFNKPLITKEIESAYNDFLNLCTNRQSKLPDK